MSETDDSSSSGHAETSKQASSAAGTTAAAATTTEEPIEVREPITVDTIRTLKRQLRDFERQHGDTGGQAREELFAAIAKQAELRKQLKECEARVAAAAGGRGVPKPPVKRDDDVPTPSPPDAPTPDPSPSPSPPPQQQRPRRDEQRRAADDGDAEAALFPAEKSGGHVVMPPSSSASSGPEQDPPGTIPIVVLCYNRPEHVKRILSRIGQLLGSFPARAFPHVPRFRLVVSQDTDGNFPEVTAAIRDAQNNALREHGLVYLSHTRDDSGATPQESDNHWEPYLAISRHYAWALAATFTKVNRHGAYRRAILVEEDLELADDFLEYMAAMSPLFDMEDTAAKQQQQQQEPDSPAQQKIGGLYCVSGFSDNGKAVLVGDAHAVYRSDFFPGLGWMLSRQLWETELRHKWPRGFWDDWMRQPVQRRGRACVRPEISRSRALCQDGEGASGGQFCEHLSQIVLYDPSRDETATRASARDHTHSAWEHFDLQSLLPKNYDAQLQQWLSEARVVYNVQAADKIIADEVARSSGGGGGGVPHRREIKMVYPHNEAFEIFAQSFNLMSDFKDNVPRTAYHGVVSFRWRGQHARAPIPPRMLPFVNDLGVVRVHLFSDRALYQ